MSRFDETHPSHPGHSAHVQQENVLLRSFTNELRRELIDKAIEAIRSDIAADVDKVMRELEPAIQTHYDQMRRDLVVRFTFKELPR